MCGIITILPFTSFFISLWLFCRRITQCQVCSLEFVTVVLLFLSFVTCFFSSFGVNMLHLLKEYTLSTCCPGFDVQGDLPEFAWRFHQDLSFVFLVYSPRNVDKFESYHPHYRAAYDSMARNKMVHGFCSLCDDVGCLVNSTMLRIVNICMFYLDKVYSFLAFP